MCKLIFKAKCKEKEKKKRNCCASWSQTMKSHYILLYKSNIYYIYSCSAIMKHATVTWYAFVIQIVTRQHVCSLYSLQWLNEVLRNKPNANRLAKIINNNNSDATNNNINKNAAQYKFHEFIPIHWNDDYSFYFSAFFSFPLALCIFCI